MSKRKNPSSGPRLPRGLQNKEGVLSPAKSGTPNSVRGGVSRRVALINLLAGIGAAAWGVLGAKDDQETHSKASRVRPSAVVGASEAQPRCSILDVLPEKDVPIPSFVEVEHNVILPFPVPQRLKSTGVSMEAFRQAMLELRVDERFRAELLPKLRQGSITQAELFDFLDSLFQTKSYIAAALNDIHDYINSESDFDRTVGGFFAILNAYFLPAGLFLEDGMEEKVGLYCPDLLKVDGTMRFKVGDGEREEEILVVSVHDGIGGWEVKKAVAERGGTPMEYYFERGYCVLKHEIAEAVLPFSEPVSIKYNDLTVIGKSFNEVMLQSYLRHELGHGFLGKKFPMATKHVVGKGGNVPHYNLGADLRPLTSRAGFRVIELHELASVAIELATSEERVSYRLYQDSGWADMVDGDSYFLAKILLPVAILKVARESGYRNLALASLEAGRIDYQMLKEIFIAKDWTQADTRRVGQLMYNFAHKALEDIESGVVRE